MAILGIIFPIFALIAIGYFLRALGLVRPTWAHVLNTFVYYVSLPALILTSFWRIDWGNPDMIGLLAFQIVALVAFVLALWLVLALRLRSARFRTTFLVTSSLGNTVYMGFPLGLLIFGEAGGAALVGAGTVQLLAGIILSFFVIEASVVKSRNWLGYLKDLGKNPLILSMLAGILLNLSVRESDVDFLADTLQGLSATASPLALFALGAFVHGRFAKAHLISTLWSSFIKLLVFPLFVFVLAKLWGLSDPMAAISLLISAMPNAATSFVLAEKYELDKEFVANSISVSTVISAGTIYIVIKMILG